MYATPNGAVARVTSVPGEAARLASSPMSCETLSEMFGFTTRILIATPHQVALECSLRSSGIATVRAAGITRQRDKEDTCRCAGVSATEATPRSPRRQADLLPG